MKTILSGILILLLASCISQKKCYERFPPQIITKDSVVLKDTTIYLTIRDTIAGETVKVYDSIPCPDLEYHKEVSSKSGRTTAKVDISKGKLSVDCKTDSIIKVLEDVRAQLKVSESYHSQTVVVDKPVVEYKTPSWAWALLSLSIFGVLFFAYRIFNLLK